MSEEKDKYQLQEIGASGNLLRYAIVAEGVSKASNSTIEQQYGSDTSFFGSGEIGDARYTMTEVNGREIEYINYGDDDNMPYVLQNLLRKNMVAQRAMAFNVKCCYGQGIRFVDRESKKDVTTDEIRDFCLRNSIHEVFMQQATDMKFFNWSVEVIILSKDHKRIVNIRHKDVSYCRLQKPNASGRIENVIFGDFRKYGSSIEGEIIPLLDIYDPLGDLLARMGKAPDPYTGITGKEPRDGKDCKFAIISRMPTPGIQFYPVPYYASIFDDAWYDIYRLIGIGKRYMIKNTSAPRIQIEVHRDYWDDLCNNEGIIDAEARKARILKEKDDIINFVCGPENAGKALITGYYFDPNGKEQRMVRIINLSDGGKKEGGDWADDMSEASNSLCFALDCHPNLIGATPGKSQMNNSGSDKRELFIMKQSLEKSEHDIMAKPWHVILHYNTWAEQGVTCDVPMIELTTLDQNKDKQKSLVTNKGKDNGKED
nr:MAG TPA: hypothetical protein [Caudoviricetes sp.]